MQVPLSSLRHHSAKRMGTPENFLWDPSVGAHGSWATQDISNTQLNCGGEGRTFFFQEAQPAKLLPRETGPSFAVSAPSVLLEVQAMSSALISLDTGSEKPWSGLLTLRFGPAFPRTQQSTCFPPQPPVTATPGIVFSLWWVCCVPLYQHGFSFHHLCHLRSTFSPALKSHGLNYKRSPWLFAYGETSRAEFHGCSTEILLRSLDDSL